MAQCIQDLVSDCGATFIRKEGGDYPGPNTIKLAILAAKGLGVTVVLSKDSIQPDIHVLSWYIDINSTTQLNNATFGGQVNPHHKRKATYVAYGFDNLLSQLKHGLEMAADGSSFLNSAPSAS